ncbi:helix-turn-helix transcriptional regulator [Listeria monocytogenes]|nr:helix-turn-helix transcriptional regulator [Listeria monocytogenes]
MISVGNRIKKARIHKGLTQKQLADKIYISSQVISNAEREYAEVTSSNLLQIAEVLEVSTDYLLGKDGIENINLSSTPIDDNLNEKE